jgi:hypothetical protein
MVIDTLNGSGRFFYGECCACDGKLQNSEKVFRPTRGSLLDEKSSTEVPIT